jgi:hypothetical protein
MGPNWKTLPLPRDLRASAFVVENGEHLWRAEQAIEVADWLATQELGILGGEIYARHDVGWGTFVRDWLTEPMRRPHESWQAYVSRAKQQAVGMVLSNRRPSTAAEAGADHLYFLAFSGEAAYPDDPIRPARAA